MEIEIGFFYVHESHSETVFYVLPVIDYVEIWIYSDEIGNVIAFLKGSWSLEKKKVFYLLSES